MKGRICIVDHDFASRGYLRECLEKEGMHVRTLDTGFQIKSLSSEENFDVFILNIDTPGVRDKNLLLDIKKSHHQDSFDRFRKGGRFPEGGDRSRSLWLSSTNPSIMKKFAQWSTI